MLNDLPEDNFKDRNLNEKKSQLHKCGTKMAYYKGMILFQTM
jgi:hypothetical protein